MNINQGPEQSTPDMSILGVGMRLPHLASAVPEGRSLSTVENRHHPLWEGDLHEIARTIIGIVNGETSCQKDPI